MPFSFVNLTSFHLFSQPDGSLQLNPSLRKQMQLLLDEVQSSGVDELDKVSLERLADINPDLLDQIKQEAEIVLNEQKQQQQHSTPSDALTEDLSEWSKLKLDHLEKSHTIIASLNHHVRAAAQQTTVVKSEMESTVHLYASVSASAQLLTDMLTQWKIQNEGGAGSLGDENINNSNRRKRRYSLVKKEKFTTEGVKERNDAVIARLYEVGLPFVCSADGRRFGTQLELSKHLDSLFRKSQLEKTMDKTEERGWYVEESVWIGDSKASATYVDDPTGTDQLQPDTAVDEQTSPTSTVIADETRDRCTLCGINFAMFFDQEDGEWKYKNCIEKSVWKDEGPTMEEEEEEEESHLVHVSCWEGLGSPEFLTADQILHAS